jgi:hypothetical protein
MNRDTALANIRAQVMWNRLIAVVEEQAQTLVRHIQAALKASTGIDGRLLRKRDDPSTWMEIYEGVGEISAFEQCLTSAVQATNFAAVLVTDGVRHMECFEDSCA